MYIRPTFTLQLERAYCMYHQWALYHSLSSMIELINYIYKL